MSKSGKPYVGSRCGGNGEIESKGWSPCKRHGDEVKATMRLVDLK